jgi:nucleotide-binding universal stress UspA family protein
MVMLTGVDRVATVPSTDAPHVVVGVGGWPALAWARDEVAATGGWLTICHAGSTPPGGPTMDSLTLWDPVFTRAVHDTRLRLGGDRVAVWLEDGDPVDVLAQASEDADLLVIGPPRSDRHRSTAVRIAETCRRPVVVVRPVPGGRDAPYAGHVIAAVGGGPVDAMVVDTAMRYAATHHLPMAAIHVSADSPGDFWFDEETLETHFSVEPPQLGLLAGLVEPARARYPSVPVRLCVLAGTPVPRLLEAGCGARLVVVGRRHRKLAVPLLGHTSRELVIAADGPVAVVPSN